MNDPKTGVYFHEKCLEISRLTADRGGEMSANHRLGVAYEKMVRCVERSRSCWGSADLRWLRNRLWQLGRFGKWTHPTQVRVGTGVLTTQK